MFLEILLLITFALLALFIYFGHTDNDKWNEISFFCAGMAGFFALWECNVLKYYGAMVMVAVILIMYYTSEMLEKYNRK